MIDDEDDEDSSHLLGWLDMWCMVAWSLEGRWKVEDQWGDHALRGIIKYYTWEDDITKKHAIACHIRWILILCTEYAFILTYSVPVGRYCYLITSWGSIYRECIRSWLPRCGRVVVMMDDSSQTGATVQPYNRTQTKVRSWSWSHLSLSVLTP